MARAASDDSDDEFSQALECSIHFGVLQQPKALPCMHTFCRDCLVPLVKNNQIKCPICREVCQLPAKGVNGLRNNTALQNILDTLCASCQKRPKKTKCPCCRQKLCDKCKIQHSSKFQTKISRNKQELSSVAQALSNINQARKFSKALECSIHFGLLKQPKALPCQHTFCRDCLVPLEEKNQIKCPICREVCQLPAKGVDGLRNNIALQNILDTLCASCQKRPKKTKCPCCRRKLCDKCKIQHSSKFQTKITGKKQELRNMAQALSNISQGLGQNKTRFLSQVANTKSEAKTFITKVIEQLQRRQAQLETELNSLIETETKRINECQENIKKREQEIQAALQRSDGDATAILENLERLSENITALLSTMAVSPATVSCQLDEQLVQDVCMGLGQIEYTPPQPGSGATTDLLQYQPVTIDYQAIGTPRKKQPGSGARTDLPQYQPVTIDYQTIGTPRKVFGQKGSGPGQFNGPTHLAVSPVSGNLVVCDSENSRVQIFTADGKFIRKFGSKGQGGGQFDFGSFIYSGGVTVTDRGEIVIADTFNHRLQVFDEAGGFIRVIGSVGSAPGKFKVPSGVTCDHSDQLYICDFNNERVQVMTMAGSVVRIIAAINVPGGHWEPGDIAVCPDGDLVVADWYEGLHVLSARGQHKATIRCGKGQHIECRHAVGVAVDPQGHILVTDGDATHRVYVLKKTGELVCSFGGDGTSPGKFN